MRTIASLQRYYHNAHHIQTDLILNERTGDKNLKTKQLGLIKVIRQILKKIIGYRQRWSQVLPSHGSVRLPGLILLVISATFNWLTLPGNVTTLLHYAFTVAIVFFLSD